MNRLIFGMKRLSWVDRFFFIAFFAFFLIFTAKALMIHQSFGTAAYDLGIFAQNFWKFSRFEDAFNTVRGLHAHGDHFQPIEMLFIVLYWITPRIEWMLLVQVLAVIWAGLLVRQLAQRLIPQSPIFAWMLALAFLINPVTHNPLLWQYHGLVLALPLYLAWIQAYLDRRAGLFVLLLLLLLLVREDIPATTICFGMVALTQYRWREGAITIILSILYWWVATHGVMAYFNGEGYFRDDAGTVQTLLSHFNDPAYYVQRLWHEPDARIYLGFLFLPFLLLPLVSPRWLLPAMPSILANVLIGGYNTQIGYHYSVNAIPFILLATLMTLATWLPRRPTLGPWIGLAFLIAAGLAARYGSLMPLDRLADDYQTWQQRAPLREWFEEQNHSLGSDVGVAASDFLLPHVANRQSIYLFPNPWRIHYWGIRGEQPRHPNEVDYLVLNPEHAAEYPKILRYLLDQDYFITVYKDDSVWFLKRQRLEPIKREAAIRALDEYRIDHGIHFGTLALGPVWSMPVTGAFTPADTPPPSNWSRADLADRSWLALDLAAMEPAAGAALRDIYAPLHVDQITEAELLLGSDDGLMVWLNGHLLLDRRVLRIARPDDDRLRIKLRPGINHLYFRVDTIGGAWKLFAEIKPFAPQRTPDE